MVSALTKHPAIATCAFYVVLLGAASITELLASLSGSQLSLWLSTGVVLAAMVVTPVSTWVRWAGAAILAEFTGNLLWYGHQWGPTLLLIFGNILAAVSGASVIRHVSKGPYFLDTVRQATIFAAIVIILVPLISASIGSAALGWSYNKEPLDAWTRLVLGDATGGILAAPICLLILNAAAPRSRFSARRNVEAAFLVIAFATMAAISLGGIVPFVFLMIPLSLWASLRFTSPGAIISSAALTLLTAVFTFAGASPFAQSSEAGGYQFAGLQLFILVASTTALLIGAMAEENRRGIGLLRSLNQTLQERDAERAIRLVSTEARARETESLLSAIGEACPDLIYAKNLQFEIIYANAATLRTLGADSSEELSLRGEQSYYLSDSEFTRIRSNDENVIATEKMVVIEEVLTNPDGELHFYRTTKAPLYDSVGQLKGLAGVSVDITDMKKAQDREHMLVREVEHRSRNLLAVVHGIVQLAHAENVAELKKILGKRIGALARTNGAIAASNWRGVSLTKILVEELAPYHDDNSHRSTLSGPELPLDPTTAQSITLVLHELATNAAKYGALSVEFGSVKVKWACRSQEGDIALVDLEWRETGGPLVTPPTRKGFGSAVIGAFGDDRPETGVTFNWNPDGLRVAMVFAVSKVMQENTPAT